MCVFVCAVCGRVVRACERAMRVMRCVRVRAYVCGCALCAHLHVGSDPRQHRHARRYRLLLRERKETLLAGWLTSCSDSTARS